MSVERFEPCFQVGFKEMEKHIIGGYVQYGDYATLLASHSKLVGALKAIKSRVALVSPYYEQVQEALSEAEKVSQ